MVKKSSESKKWLSFIQCASNDNWVQVYYSGYLESKLPIVFLNFRIKMFRYKEKMIKSIWQ